MGFFSQAAAAVATAATISVNVCSAVSFTGNSTHHNQPLSQKIALDDIAHRGPYVGPRHTGSLDQARSTIFLKPGSKSMSGTLALHVVQSQMALTHLIISAKAGQAAAPAPVQTAKAEAPAPRPAALSKPMSTTGV